MPNKIELDALVYQVARIHIKDALRRDGVKISSCKPEEISANARALVDKEPSIRKAVEKLFK